MNSVDRHGNILAIVVMTPTYTGAFTIENDELLETVEMDPEEIWDWHQATVCDPARGENRELQTALRAALEALTREHNL